MKLTRYMLVLVILLLAAIAVSGQDVALAETFTFETGTTFSYPDGSTIVQDEKTPEFVSVELGSGQNLSLLDFAYFEAAGLEADSDLADVMAWYVDYLFEGAVEFDASTVEAMDDAIGREALRWSYVDDGGNGALMIAVRFDEGGYGLVDAYADSADFEAEDVAVAVAASFNNGAVAAAAVDSTPCMVSTGQANSVQLRVGPGTNRTVYAFLPAEREFAPLGKAAASDDSQWFQLDKAEVAPNASAAEAWVAADDVETTGNCATIGEADAPPVIPIVPAAPPADSGGSDSGAGDSGGGPVPAGGQVPQSGSWTVTTNNYIDASCAGTDNMRANVPVQSFGVSISVRGGGASFTTGGDTFVKTGPGQYAGSTTFPDGTNGQVYLTVNSPTLMTGNSVLNFTIQGHACSGTLGLRMTHN